MRAAIVLIALTIASTVAAQPADVPGMIKFVDTQPSDMDRSTWKEKRRDVTRKLGQSKDKRATPLLMRLAETETFDVIGDIAIEGLGTLGDQSAVPTLQRVLADTSRDKSSRDLAKKALNRLGAPEVGSSAPPPPPPKETPPPPKETPKQTPPPPKETPKQTPPPPPKETRTTTGGSTTTAEAGTESTDLGSGATTGGFTDSLIGASTESTQVENMPELADDVIAAAERLHFAAGTANLQIESLPATNAGESRVQNVNFGADVEATYLKKLDAETRAYTIDGDAHLVAGIVNPEGRGVTRGATFNTRIAGEARFYSNKLYGVGKAVGALSIQYLGYVDAMDPNNDLKDTTTQFDLQIALGGGYGRVVDVGSAIRVRRLSRILDDARALGKPIDAATAKKLQLTWWALRKERSDFRALIATVAVLREAGILLGEPNAVITYEILTVLRDTNLFLRPSGFDAQLVVGEGYLKRPTDDAGNCNEICGRLEQVIASAGYGAQLDDDKMELSGDAYARYRLFADGDAGEPSPWAVGVTGRMRRFTYGEHGEPFGVLDLTGDIAASSNGSADMNNPSDKALRIMGELGFTYIVNQASGIRVAAQLAEDSGTLFFGASLQATYGFLDGSYAR
jgi:hypothetical protein